MFSELDTLIDETKDLYDECMKEWLSSHTVLSTKKTEIRHVHEDPQKLEVIRDFHNFMDARSLQFFLIASKIQHNAGSSFKITSRVKTWNSINYKIDTYMNKGDVEGKVPFMKSFNDLFGIRIILPYAFTHEELVAYVSEHRPELKVTDSTKNGYKASHIYFMPENKKMFPWEIQVWYSGDEDSNLQSHHQYKQGYTDWEKKFKEGGV